MVEPGGEIIVGVLGQYASGKSEAAKTLVQYLGGDDAVVFITDRALLARQAVRHLLQQQDIRSGTEEDGRQRLDGGHVTVWLRPGEKLDTLDLSMLRFDVRGAILPDWLDRSRAELGHEIRERSSQGKPVVIEAGFGRDPQFQTLSHLFARLSEAGVEPGHVKWILVEASYEKRVERNAKRPAKVDVGLFARLAAEGGDLDPEAQRRLEEQGTTIKRVPNEHDDLQKFRTDVIAAFKEIFGRSRPVSA